MVPGSLLDSFNCNTICFKMKKRRYLKYWRYHARKEQKLLNAAYRRFWNEWLRYEVDNWERITWGLPTTKEFN